MDVLEILNAWLIARHPTQEQSELAEERKKVCIGCEHFKNHEPTNLFYCGECFCPISKKIFSPKNNPCPLKKFNE